MKNLVATSSLLLSRYSPRPKDTTKKTSIQPSFQPPSLIHIHQPHTISHSLTINRDDFRLWQQPRVRSKLAADGEQLAVIADGQWRWRWWFQHTHTRGK